jgi:AcrR family transcriptional regulator
MSIPYERTGRTRQKARTRRALVEAARELLVQGVTPTVEQAADAAGVSRTTAYRYFPNQHAPPQDPEARLAAAAQALGHLVVEHEPELRAQLRLSLEPDGSGGDRGAHRDLPFRTGQSIVWIEEALAPLRGKLPEPQFRRLVLAIRTAVGIEALVWLADIAGLSRDEAVELMCWSAQALLRPALEEHATEHTTASTERGGGEVTARSATTTFDERERI